MDQIEQEQVYIQKACKRMGFYAFIDGIWPIGDKYYHVASSRKAPTYAYAYIESGKTGAQVYLMLLEQKRYRAFALFCSNGNMEVIEMQEPKTIALAERLFEPLTSRIAQMLAVKNFH